ncbi:MAG: hypothetical protein LBF68_03795 [Christensenellaceae bacterium]|nr:hypothetical protein [Christensenellaceae bacterium]
MTDKDYTTGIWFNSGSYNSSWRLESENRGQWDNAEQEERHEYYLDKTEKAPKSALIMIIV